MFFERVIRHGKCHVSEWISYLLRKKLMHCRYKCDPLIGLNSDYRESGEILVSPYCACAGDRAVFPSFHSVVNEILERQHRNGFYPVTIYVSDPETGWLDIFFDSGLVATVPHARRLILMVTGTKNQYPVNVPFIFRCVLIPNYFRPILLTCDVIVCLTHVYK